MLQKLAMITVWASGFTAGATGILSILDIGPLETRTHLRFGCYLALQTFVVLPIALGWLRIERNKPWGPLDRLKQ